MFRSECYADYREMWRMALRSYAALAVLSLAAGFVLGFSAGTLYVESIAGLRGASVGVGVAEEPLKGLYGRVSVDGSSTVYPITEFIAEVFMEEFPGVEVVIGVSGTGGGFKRFILGEIQINDASRPIKPVEAEKALARGIEWIEIPIAIDGVVIAVNPENDWLECITIGELREIWKPDSRVRKWSDLREGWPDERIRLYGPGPDSGTFDYFTEAVVGEKGSSRTDYTASEDDNVLVEGVARDRYSLGYFGLAYYMENRDRLKAVAVDAGSGCVLPTIENVSTFKYPLSRPLFIYVNADSFEGDPAVRAFVIYYLDHAYEASLYAGYAPFPREYYVASKALLEAGIYQGLLELATRWAPGLSG